MLDEGEHNFHTQATLSTERATLDQTLTAHQTLATVPIALVTEQSRLTLKGTTS